MPRELLENSTYLATLINETASLSLDGHEPPTSEQAGSFPQVAYLRPFHAAQFVDRLIEDAKPSLWTTVCENDKLMRRLLRNHFLSEFYFMSALHKDFFFRDMISGEGEFCSSLLVNAVLAYACVCDPEIPNRAEYWNPRSLTYKFLVEAKRLWEMEAAVSHVTTIQAGIILNGICNLSGLDELGNTYRTHCIELANRLHWYSAPITATSERSRRCQIYTAWALLCWDSYPPRVPRPPPDTVPSSKDNLQWFGRFWLRYPEHKTLMTGNFGVFFEYRARFRMIVAGFAARPTERATLLQYRSDMHIFVVRNCSNGLTPYPCHYSPKTLCSQHNYNFSESNKRDQTVTNVYSMYYYHLMVTIFEPLLDVETYQRPRPKAIVYEAKRCFSTLYRLYYIRHGHYHMDIHINISLIFAGTTCLDAIQQQPQGSDLENLRSTLILCATGLYHQRRNTYLAHALYSLLRARMRPEEVALLKQVPDLVDDEQALILQQQTRSKWLENVVKTEADLDHDTRNNPVSGP